MYKRLPIDKKVIEQMKISTPEIYRDMVEKYGEENVINNLLVPFNVLTEDKNIVVGKDQVTIKVTKELINEVMKASNSAFQVYLKEPINRLKSWITEGDSSLGYTPIILNHNPDTPKQGYILGGSYKAVNLDGKLHLLCEGVLVNPEGKFKWLNGEYREVSPTMLASNKSISETSFVNIPAQMTNTSLSAGDEINIANANTPVVVSSVIADWETKIQAAKIAAVDEIQQNKIRQKELLAINLTEQLLKKGVIVSAQRSKIKDVFIQLSSGEESLVANALLDVGKSPLYRKPRNMFLKGTIDMSKSKDERYLEFSEKNKGKFAHPADMITAFEKQEVATSVSLSSGDGQLTDPMSDILSQLDVLQKNGGLTEEHQKSLAKFCPHTPEVSLSDDANVGDGKNVTPGGIDITNNTSLNSGAEAFVASAAHTEMLEKGFAATKAEAEAYKARADAAEAKLTELKQSLGV